MLDDWTVDWLTHPHLTTDSWIHFLVKHEWQNTAIGPMHTWDPILRQVYTIILSSTEPRVLYWGNDLCMFYNAAARSLVGEMHPSPLGNPLADVWGAPMCSHLTEILISGIKQGKPLHNKGTELVIERGGLPESCFFDFVFLPIPSPDGRFIGFINEFTDTTTAVLQESRRDVCKTLLENVVRSTETREIWNGLTHVLEEKCRDVSFGIVYAYDKVGLPDSNIKLMQAQSSFGIDSFESDIPAPIHAALRGPASKVIVLEQKKNTLPPELALHIPDTGNVNTVYVLPIDGLHNTLSAVVVLGSSPVRPFDSSSLQFLESLRDLLFKSFALFSLPMEHRRAKELTTALAHQLETANLKAETSEKNFTSMVHDSPIGMCMDRNDGYPVYVNDMYLELMGIDRTSFDKAAARGFAWRSAAFVDDTRLIEDSWKAAVKSKKATSFEIRMKLDASPTGFRWLEVSVQQRYDENGEMAFIFSWLTDISARKLTESSARERLAEALENKRSSENFIDMISHEMRNPLSSILQLADSIPLSLPPVTKDTTDAHNTLLDTAQTITLCAKHQKSIIDEVLTFSKLDSRLILLVPERVQPLAIVGTVLKMIQSELDHADIHGSVDVQQVYIDLGVDYALLDPGRITQVIINLMMNAIKFTKTSNDRQIKINIAASRTKPTAKDCQATLIEPRENKLNDATRSLSTNESCPSDKEIFLTFSVKDTGCGLTDAETKSLFQRFSQASPKTYKQYGGSGLGLFISRELVELHGGQAGVSSDAGKGSTFSFYIKATSVGPPEALSKPAEVDNPSMLSTASQGTASFDLPLRKPSTSTEINGLPTTSSPHQTPPGDAVTCKTEIQDLHVLVVEDNTINQKVMAQQLVKSGCAMVHVANHGLDALDFLSTSNFYDSTNNIPLSVVLLDVEMPIMDGLTAARRVRELEKESVISRHVPIIGITANARANQIASCIDAGMDEVVTKPFRMFQLIPRMLALVDKHKSPG